jgi:hypothetical protein
MAKLTDRSQSGTITSSSVIHVVNDPTGSPASSKETLSSVFSTISPENGVSFHTGNGTLTRVQMSQGHTNYVTSAAELEMLAVDTETSFSVVTIGAIAVSVDAFATDLLYLDGTALDDGDKITNASTAGDIATIQYYNATGAYASTNGWTDGGA